MEIYVAEQTRSFLWSCLLGAGLGAFYDIFRILRVAFPAKKAVLFIQDLLFWLVCAGTSFLFLLTANDGVVRVFLLVGEGIGWVLYHCTLGRLVMQIAEAVIRAIQAVLHFIWRFLLYPIWRIVYTIISWILRPAYFVGNFLKKTWQTGKIRLKVRGRVLYNHCKDSARRGMGAITVRFREKGHGKEKAEAE